jgi:peptide deformylase
VPFLTLFCLSLRVNAPAMALLPILRYPDPRLHKVARPVEAVDDSLRQLADDMIETMYDAKEGCLSVPGIYDGVERAERVHVRALDRQGESFELQAEGMLAVCVQHELDHLLGKVFVEYLSPLKRNRIKAKLVKAQREEAKA